MNNDTRLAVATHILALLSFSQRDYWSSDLLARSVNTNAVVIRRVTGLLKKAGIVDIRRGVGGTTLHRKPEEITLLDVYDAVIPHSKDAPFYLHQNPNCNCYVGRNIHDALEVPFTKVNEGMRKGLAETTIAEVATFIRNQELTKK